MASNNKVNVIEVSNFAGLPALIEADITTEQANGFDLVNCFWTAYVDTQGSGAVRSLMFLIYNKANRGYNQIDLTPSSGGFSQSTVGTTASQPISSLDASTTHVMITVNTASIRVRFDGTNPTGSIGHLIDIGDSVVWSKALALAAKAIRSTGSLVDSNLSISQLKY